MHSSLLLYLTPLFLSTASAVWDNASSYVHFDCGTDKGAASDHFVDTVSQLHQNNGNKPGSLAARAASLVRRDNSNINVNAYFHIVTTDASKSAITQQMATDQLNAMNTAYKPYNIQFTLKNTSFTTNAKWAVGAGDDDKAMKQALRQGTYADLNIYFQTDLAGSNLGLCALPTDMGPKPIPAANYVTDGCNVNANTMPGGQLQGYNLGKTAVHETGHWLGLLHTFEGKTCDGSGDYIDDTPPESQSTDGCPTKPAKDSCPNAPGVDPIHNYMDYSYDSCYEGFTDLQHQRMQHLWAQYRSGN